MSVVATVREAPAVPADRVGSPAPMVAVPQQAANEAWLMSRMLVDPVVHDDCIAWTDADTARKGIALDEARGGPTPCFSQHVSNVCACCRAGLTTAPAAPRQKRTSSRRRTKRPLSVHARGSSHQSAVRPNSQTVRSNREEAESDDA